MNKHFASNLLPQGSIEKDYLSGNVKMFSFWGQLIKILISVLSFSIKLAKKLLTAIDSRKFEGYIYLSKAIVALLF